MPECCHCTIAKIQQVLPKEHVQKPKNQGPKKTSQSYSGGLFE
jgi:hypothetical protein